VRIAHVCPYDWEVAGGVREHVVNLSRRQRAMGHQVTVFAPSSNRSPSDPEVTFIPGHIVGVPGARSIARISASPAVWRRMRGLLTADAFDVVHIHEPLVPMVSIAALRHAGAVTVGTIHGYRPGYPLYQLLRWPLDRMMRRLTARVAVSVDARAWVHQYFPGTYEIIPDGVDVQRYRDPAIRPIERFDDGCPNILFVGRLERRKGFSVLVDAFERVKREIPDARLIVVGAFGDEDRRHWAAEVASRRLSDVELVGFVPEGELPRYYRVASVFCAPSTGYEALGIVLLEAMASGTPVVTTDIVGYRTVVRDGVEALVVPPAAVRPLADALITVLGEPELRERLVEAGHRRVEQYDWPILARRLLGVYEAHLAGPRSAPESRSIDEQHYTAVLDVLVKVLEVSPEGLDPDTAFEHMGLDSLDMAELSLAIEERTGIEIDDGDLGSLRSIRDLAALLVARTS